MKTHSILYFIALLPTENISKKIIAIKQEFVEKYNSRKSLNSPPHITLQASFKRPADTELIMIKGLNEFAKRQHPFEVRLEGFGAFPLRVIYINVTEHAPVKLLHNQLKTFLKDKLDLSKEDITRKFSPHLTVATRDLSKKQFHKAWPQFENREFEYSFSASGISLLKHNKKYWEVLKSFEFNKSLGK